MTAINRKDFFRKACFSGICMCGFASIALSENKQTEQAEEDQDGKQVLMQSWISTLLSKMDQELDEEVKRKVIKSCSLVHYTDLNMDAVLSPYTGNLEGFITFLEEKWGWKIDYNETAKTLIADENKDYCVCPVINSKDGVDKSALCYCSEGFAEKMFSTVAGKPVRASVLSSILRGDESCKYRIEFNG